MPISPNMAVMNSTRRQNSLGEDNLRNFVGKTQGMIKSGIISVLEGGSDIFSGTCRASLTLNHVDNCVLFIPLGISSKLESALSLSATSSSEPNEHLATEMLETPSKDSACDMSLSLPGDRELVANGPDPYDKFIYKIGNF